MFMGSRCFFLILIIFYDYFLFFYWHVYIITGYIYIFRVGVDFNSL